jgi:hypothetical protein
VRAALEIRTPEKKRKAVDIASDPLAAKRVAAKSVAAQDEIVPEPKPEAARIDATVAVQTLTSKS